MENESLLDAVWTDTVYQTKVTRQCLTVRLAIVESSRRLTIEFSLSLQIEFFFKEIFHFFGRESLLKPADQSLIFFDAPAIVEFAPSISRPRIHGMLFVEFQIHLKSNSSWTRKFGVKFDLMLLKVRAHFEKDWKSFDKLLFILLVSR